MPQGAFYTMPNITKTKLNSREMEHLLLEELKIATVAKIETKEAFKIKILLLIRFDIFSLILKK